jgi:hypothetical protein
MTAPSCPISISQLPKSYGPKAPTTVSIPMAFDLSSLIRTVNITREVLRQLTTSLTVNNVYLPRPPNFKAEGDKYYSEYPAWDQKTIETSEGYMFHKEKGVPDKNIRAYVRRQNRILYENRSQNDPEFKWSYSKPLDQTVK